MNSLPSLIIRLSHNPFDSLLNFDVAEKYLENNQTASAVSFYLRCVEYAPVGSVEGYASLLRMAQCFNDQKGRELSVTNCLLQALAYDDMRPEAYFMLSRFHENAGNWQEAYTFAHIGIGLTYLGNEELPCDIGYPGDYALEFQKAISAWWIGRADESIDRLRKLLNKDLNETYRNAVTYNLEKVNALL